MAVQKFHLVWGNVQIHPYRTTLQQPLTETPKTVHSSLVSWKIQFDWNPKQFLPVWLYCSALHGTTLTADSGGVCTVWIESTVTSTLPLLSAGASENRGGNCTGRSRL